MEYIQQGRSCFHLFLYTHIHIYHRHVLQAVADTNLALAPAVVREEVGGGTAANTRARSSAKGDSEKRLLRVHSSGKFWGREGENSRGDRIRNFSGEVPSPYVPSVCE